MAFFLLLSNCTVEKVKCQSGPFLPHWKGQTFKNDISVQAFGFFENVKWTKAAVLTFAEAMLLRNFVSLLFCRSKVF